MGLTEIKSEMSRRSARIFVEEQEFIDRSNNITLSSSSREGSVDGSEKVHQSTMTKTTAAGVETTQSSMVSMGRSVDICPTGAEDVSLHSKFSISHQLSSLQSQWLFKLLNLPGSCTPEPRLLHTSSQDLLQ